MPDGYQVDPEQLRGAARQIDDCSERGRTIEVAQATADAAACGHSELGSALEQFCYTWQVATAGMVQRLDGHSTMLQNTAARYEHSEQDAADQLGRAAGRR